MGRTEPPTRTWCARLHLVDFRNHADFRIDADARPVCLFGPNGAGKTNILEALTMLAPGRGLRGAEMGDMARGGPEAGRARPRAWSVAAALERDGESIALGVGAEPGAEAGFKRVVRRDGRPAAGADLADAARMLWVTPAMDRLFAGPAGERRRFLDRLTLARAAGHGVAAAGYERAMRERQRLLNDRVANPAWLGALEREMAAHAAAVAAARVETVGVLAGAIAARPDGAFPKAVIALEGLLEAAFAAGEASAHIEDRFLAALQAGRARDAAAGRALEGPHRSDLKVRHEGKNIPAELCSTGEQKALLLGLVLAQGQALADDPGAGPALLLIDEAAAHLDAARRAALYAELARAPGQSWLTGTDQNLFEAFEAQAQIVGVG
jgi:DNA replication and repair protein RecF